MAMGNLLPELVSNAYCLSNLTLLLRRVDNSAMRFCYNARITIM